MGSSTRESARRKMSSASGWLFGLDILCPSEQTSVSQLPQSKTNTSPPVLDFHHGCVQPLGQFLVQKGIVARRLHLQPKDLEEPGVIFELLHQPNQMLASEVFVFGVPKARGPLIEGGVRQVLAAGSLIIGVNARLGAFRSNQIEKGALEYLAQIRQDPRGCGWSFGQGPGHGCVERIEELEQRGAGQVSGTVAPGEDEFVAPP